MRYRNLGRAGVKVSPLCLGTMNFGPRTTEEESFAIMDRALEEGINFFDTANRYGAQVHVGYTEEIIGRWLAQGGGRREKVVLATKVYGPMGDGPNDQGLSARHIRLAVEDSLRRLQTDFIDLYQMHHVDRDVPWEEIWGAMEQLVREGKILYAGSSNFAALHIAQAQCSAGQRHFMGLVSEQSLYNLRDRMIELEVIPACREYGLGLIPWSPLASGMLAGGVAGAESGRRAHEWVQDALPEYRQQVEAYEAFCAQTGRDPAQVALAWLLKNPDVTSPIIGPRTMEQLESALAVLEMELSDEDMERLDEIWPGPGGEAPEAYAW
jgi:aryl-alcohol dehydrogenase-like predicted oxidoreductase